MKSNGDYAREAMEALEREAGDLFARLTQTDRELLFRCFHRAGAAQAAIAAGGVVPPRERAHIDAQLMGVSSAIQARITSAFWLVVRDMARKAFSAFVTFASK